MALFTKTIDPLAKAQRDLEARLQANLDQGEKTAARIRAAAAKSAEARSSVERISLSDDDAKLDAALAYVRACDDKLAALTASATRTGAEQAEIEAKIAEIIDRRTRIDTNAAILAVVDQWQAQERDLIAAARALEETSNEALRIGVLDAAGTSQFLKSTIDQVPPAGQLITLLLRNYAEGVLAGKGKPSLPQPAAPPPQLTLVEAPTMEIVARRHVRYFYDGKVVVVGKLQRHTMPKSIAEIGLKSGVLAAITDPSIRDQIGSWGSMLPSADRCEWLGRPSPEKAAPKPIDPILSSSAAFEPMPGIGKPYSVRVPVQPLVEPASASRKLEGE